MTTENEEIDQKNKTNKVPRDVSLDQALSRQAVTKKGITAKDKKLILGGSAGVIVLILFYLIFTSGPSKGPQVFGICTTLLELNLPYAHTMQVTDWENLSTGIRIYFNSIDPFGQKRDEIFECSFAPDKKNGIKITGASRNRKPIDAKKVEAFNESFPVFKNTELNLVMPPDWKNPLIPEDVVPEVKPLP